METPTVTQLVHRTARRARKVLPSLALYLKAAEQANYPAEHLEVIQHLITELKAIESLEEAQFDIPKRNPGRPHLSRPKITDFTAQIFAATVPKKPRKKKAIDPKAVVAKIILKDFTEERIAEEAAAGIPDTAINSDGDVVVFDFDKHF